MRQAWKQDDIMLATFLNSCAGILRYGIYNKHHDINIFNPQEPHIHQSLFHEMHFIQQFAKVFYCQSFPLYSNVISIPPHIHSISIMWDCEVIAV